MNFNSNSSRLFKWCIKKKFWWFLPKSLQMLISSFICGKILFKLHNQNQRENSLIHYIVQKLIICAVTFEHANTTHASKEMLLWCFFNSLNPTSDLNVSSFVPVISKSTWYKSFQELLKSFIWYSKLSISRMCYLLKLNHGY